MLCSVVILLLPAAQHYEFLTFALNSAREKKSLFYISFIILFVIRLSCIISVPWDIMEDELIDSFRAYGGCRVEWPGKEARYMRGKERAAYGTISASPTTKVA